MSVLLDEETVVLEGLDFEIPCAAFGIDSSRVSVHLRRIGTTMRPFVRSKR